jgi:hypothetical protein
VGTHIGIMKSPANLVANSLQDHSMKMTDLEVVTFFHFVYSK